MQRYFFHIWDGRDLRRDKRGVELARLEDALEDVSEMLRLLGESGEDLSRYVVEVVSDDGSATYIPARTIASPWIRRSPSAQEMNEPPERLAPASSSSRREGEGRPRT